MFIIYSIFVIVFIVGLSEIIHSFNLKLFKTKSSKNNTLVCFLYDDTAEMNLRYVIDQQRWYGNSYAEKIIAVNYIKSQEIIDRCNIIAEEFGIKIILPSELAII